MYRVLVSGYYGFGNTGDEAILMAIVESLKKLKKDIEVTALSADPYTTTNLLGIRAVQRTSPFAILKEIFRADLVISGGGGLLQDVTSSRSIPYYLFIVYMAKKLNKKVMFYANGVGPVSREINKRMIKRVGNMVDLITVRDEKSRNELENLGIDQPPIIVTADPAFVLKPIDDALGLKILEREQLTFDHDRPRIGVSVRPWNLSESRETIAKACDYMVQKYQADILFIPMQFPNDYSESQEIVNIMEEEAKIIEKPMTPGELLWLFDRMDIVFGMRLHALIFSAMMGVPLVGVVYDPKVRHFLERVKQPSAGEPHELDLSTLCRLLDYTLANKTERKMELMGMKDELTALALKNAELAIKLLEGEDEIS